MIINGDDQILGASAEYQPQSLSENILCEATRFMIGSKGRKALPTVETQPVHKSLDRISGFKYYTNHCATPDRAKRSQPGGSQKPISRVHFRIFFFLVNFDSSPISKVEQFQQEESLFISQLVKCIR